VRGGGGGSRPRAAHAEGVAATLLDVLSADALTGMLIPEDNAGCGGGGTRPRAAHAEGVAAALVVVFSADVTTGVSGPEENGGGGREGTWPRATHAEGVAATLVVVFSADVAMGEFGPEHDAVGRGNDQTVVVQRCVGRPPTPMPPRMSPPVPLGELMCFFSLSWRVSSAAGLVDEDESVNLDCENPLGCAFALLEEEEEDVPAAALPPPRPRRLRRAELRFRRLLPLVLGLLPALGQADGDAIPCTTGRTMGRAGVCE